jgi:D-glycero-D-manno-heptose 1,7-bisphosphate phosphatase
MIANSFKIADSTTMPVKNNIKRAIFLDRDGTIIEDKGHIGQVEDVAIIPGAIQALSMLQEKYLLFIVTNQSGVGLGRISKEAADRVNMFVLSELQHRGITIQQVYCCSHKRDDNCECIKPNPYFIHMAERDYGIDISQSYSIGDHPHDVAFCKLAGGNGIYVLTGHGWKHLADLEPSTLCFDNLLEAAYWIHNNSFQMEAGNARSFI